MPDGKKPGSLKVLGATFWETLREWGWAMLIALGLFQLVFGPDRLAAAFFIPGGVFIFVVQRIAEKKK
jgi:hypothetical protein